MSTPTPKPNVSTIENVDNGRAEDYVDEEVDIKVEIHAKTFIAVLVRSTPHVLELN